MDGLIMPKVKKRIKMWQKGLTADERRHLVKMGMNTRKMVDWTFNQQREQRVRDKEKHGADAVEPCFECKSIAVKLGSVV
jgi:hypothetical protein